MMPGRRLKIGVVGASHCSSEVSELAREVGRRIARKGAVLLCGGLGGVMESAARGAKEEGGLTVGVLPGELAEDANPFIDLAIVTDMGHARNVILVRSCDAVIAISGGYGTLSEIAIALKVGIPCIGLKTWDPDRSVIRTESPEEAVREAFDLIGKRGVV
jgi:uncharacterized protein (TIGR00725 family)